MKIEDNTVFSPFTSKFQDRSFPEVDGELAGYSALINIYDLKVPLPEILSFISSKHKHYTINGWKVYTLRHKPENSLKGHLTFALKYEGINLSILNALFQRIQANEWEIWIKSEPLGSYSRRIWFLYEWLTGKELDIPNIKTGNFIDALNGVVCGKVQGTTLRGFCIFPKTTPLWSKRFGLKFKGGIIG